VRSFFERARVRCAIIAFGRNSVTSAEILSFVVIGVALVLLIALNRFAVRRNREKLASGERRAAAAGEGEEAHSKDHRLGTTRRLHHVGRDSRNHSRFPVRHSRSNMPFGHLPRLLVFRQFGTSPESVTRGTDQTWNFDLATLIKGWSRYIWRNAIE
jgi:hypothetical protein